MKNSQHSLGLPASSWLLQPGRQHTIWSYWSGLKVSSPWCFTILTLLKSIWCFFPCLFFFFGIHYCCVSFIIAAVGKSSISSFFSLIAWFFSMQNLQFLVLTPKGHQSGLRTVVFGPILVLSWIFWFCFFLNFMITSAITWIFPSEKKWAWALLCGSNPEVSHYLSSVLE